MLTTTSSANSSAEKIKPDQFLRNHNNPVTLDAQGIVQKLQDLKTSSKGLSTTEAQQRLTQYGPNAIEAHEQSKWKKLLGLFLGPDSVDD